MEACMQRNSQPTAYFVSLEPERQRTQRSRAMLAESVHAFCPAKWFVLGLQLLHAHSLLILLGPAAAVLGTD